MSPEPEQIGRYRIMRRLGAGGMAAMFLAHDPVIDRQVAIKVLREGADDPEFRERFAREARAIGALRHPNIVTVFDVGEHEGVPYLVMEYVAGESLDAVIRQAPLPLARTLQIVEDVCRGLSYAHREGVVHRDVKPGNVMVGADGAVKILDFGIAQLARATESSLTQAGAIFGTLNYLPPEMLTGRSVDHRADVYAAGALAYELVARQKLYAGTIADGLLNRIMTGTHTRLSSVLPDLPLPVEAIIERSIAIDPADRYQDLSEMAADVASCRHTLQEGFTPAPAPDAPDAPAGDASDRVEPTRLAGFVPPADVPPVERRDETMFLPRVPPSAAAAPGPEWDVRLVVARSPDALNIGHMFAVPQRGMTLGRGAECDLVMRDTGWSRRHAAIEWLGGGYVIRDLGSSNGTYVNGRRVLPDRPAPLFFGASIGVGDTLLTFSYGRDSRLPDLTGAEVGGRYVLDALLRESTKAALYSARDRQLPRTVTIKLLSPELSRYAGYREQFQREARMAAQLQHPYVAKVLDSGETAVVARDGSRLVTHFLCLESMPGGNLAARMARQRQPSLDEIREWIAMLASALQYVHERGIVHGDLKPSAIVFDASGHLYLSDFAIAHQALSTDDSPPPGSPAYMAPELWDGGAATPASDQFALAALAYYMSTGVRPFEGQDNPDIRRKNFLRGPVPAHHEAAQNGRPAVPRTVSDVLQKALQVLPADRYDSVAQFGAALASALAGGRRVGAAPLVFVSYDREASGGWVRFFADRLQARFGIQVFLDTVGLDRAGRFSPQLVRAIEECDVFICFLAGTTLGSPWVNEEVRLARAHGKLMIPIFQESYAEGGHDEASPIADLLSHQGIKLFDVSGYYVDAAVEQLARLVKDAVAREPPGV